MAEAIDHFTAGNRLALGGGVWPLEFASMAPPGWCLRPWATLVVDTASDRDVIEARLKRSARKAIRKAERDGLSVRRIESLRQLQEYYRFAAQCARRYRKRMYGFRDFESMWQDIRPSGVFETFVAEKDGEMLAGLSIWGFASSAGELGSFQSERSYQEKLYGPDLVKWHAICWAHGAGLRRFDLAGVNPSPTSRKEAQIRQFKEKWGGEYIEYLTVR